uniref:Galactose oxidase/kelch repeat superfamily protein n=1 Tax=Arabidopsis thaliana TaxID=3702 RepID=Q9FHL7_ARATH|nr:unnamed protein product [Arabidopsis thaliana]
MVLLGLLGDWETKHEMESVEDPSKEKPSWRILNVPGKPPKLAWGHSTCVVGGTRVLVLGGHNGEEWILNELHELCLASWQDSDL